VYWSIHIGLYAASKSATLLIQRLRDTLEIAADPDKMSAKGSGLTTLAILEVDRSVV
jgi:hypothetical protein